MIDCDKKTKEKYTHIYDMKKMYYYIYYIPNKNMPYLTHPLKKLQVLWSLWAKQNQMKKILKLYNIYFIIKHR